ncbi:MAG: sugar nucleotide-binding protein, partial [Candidatus Poribacteria bacterium]|nr:sugar nucleotide-binding protein [Candidatus Poribacteria bacterium]
LVSGILPARLSELCAEHGKKFVHISTGCLYDRNDYPQAETDFTVSHCRYTVAKWVGECGVDPSRDLVLRPRLFFGGTEDPKNLLCKLPRFASYLEELNSYTNVEEVVNATRVLLDADASGVFNVACDGYLTVYDIAQLIGLRGGKIHADTLHRQEGLFLVNNILDLSKLKQFYQPKRLVDSVLDSHARLQNAR